MKRRAIGIGIAVSLLAVGLAMAGTVDNTLVTVDTDSATGLPRARGTLRAVRNSADSVQYIKYIGCSRCSYDAGANSALRYDQQMWK